METLTENIERILKSIEDVTWLSYNKMFFSSLGIASSKDIRKELGIRLKDDHVIVGFLISNHETNFTLESTMIIEIIKKLGYTYTKSPYRLFDHMKYSSSTFKYQVFHFCSYQPLQFKLNKHDGSLKTINISNYPNVILPITDVPDTQLSFLHVNVHIDDIRQFLMDINNHGIGTLVQYISYVGDSTLAKIENKDFSYFLTGYRLDKMVRFLDNIPCVTKEKQLKQLKIKVTNVLVTAISSKTNMTKLEVETYLIDKQYSLLDCNFIKINFRLKNPNASTWSFLFTSLDKGNVVPSLINWKDGLPQGGIVYCPLPYFSTFMNKLKLFNNDYLNLTYYPYYHT